MKRTISLILMIVLCGGLPGLAVLNQVFDRWELDVYDSLARANTQKTGQSDLVAIIMIDQATLDWGATYCVEVGGNNSDNIAYIFNWNWNRLVYALIIDYLARGGARVVAFDIDLSSPYTRDDVNGDDTLGTGTQLSNQDGRPFVIHTLNFIETASPFEIQELSDGERSCLEASALEIAGLADSNLPFDRSDIGTYCNPILPHRKILTPFLGSPPQPELLRLGAVSVQNDTDSVIRRARPFVVYESRAYPSLGLAAALAAIESRAEGPVAELRLRNHEMTLREGPDGPERSLPLTPSGDVLVEWHDDGREDPKSLDVGFFRTYPAHRVLRTILASEESWLDLPDCSIEAAAILDPAVFRDKIVFVGSNAAGLRDLKATPVSKDYPAVKIHAALAEAFLRGEAIERLPGGWRTLIAAILALAAGALTLRVRRGWLKVFLLAALIGLYTFLAVELFRSAALWIDVVAPLLGILLAYAGGTTFNYFTEGRRSREISRLFQHFAPPEVVQELIDHPQNLFEQGINREVTIFFSDIQDFTRISSTPEMHRDPGRLTNHLNAYLTEMTRTITACGGTLDKYIGDAVVAIFGAPVSLESHAAAACRAALECQSRIAAFNRSAGERGLPAFVTRIGIFTGEATVGCVGSHERFSYTAIGAPVNFASRLEGVNKVYGTSILAGGRTADEASQTIRFRALDTVRVPGIGNDQPALEVFEVLAPAEDPGPLDKDLLEDFVRARGLYRTMSFLDAAGLFEKLSKKHGDRPSYVFWKRCLDFIQSPPGDSWDGSFRIESK